MPRIALVDGVAIIMYTNDHNPPHLHARSGADEALVGIADAVVFKGSLPRGKKAAGESWVAHHRGALLEAWQRAQEGRNPGQIT